MSLTKRIAAIERSPQVGALKEVLEGKPLHECSDEELEMIIGDSHVRHLSDEELQAIIDGDEGEQA